MFVLSWLGPLMCLIGIFEIFGWVSRMRKVEEGTKVAENQFLASLHASYTTIIDLGV